MPDLLGSTLGQYRVEERLGSGGVGVVYRATQKPTDQQVALKVLDPGLTVRPGFMRRFGSQAATISKLGHPGIVPVYEIGTRSQLTYLSMRLVHGGTLKDLLGDGTEVKLRASYGETGNPPLFGQKFTTLSSTVINGAVGTVVTGVAGSPDIKPERVKEVEAGSDATLAMPWAGPHRASVM